MQKLEMTMNKVTGFRVTEAYKVVRTNLMFSGRNVKAVVFTSSLENEGKSTVTWNLSISLAESGKRVLFIDADMRKSVFSGKNRVLTRAKGLSHFLSGQASLDEVVCSTDLENLHVMMTGVFPPNPAELLSHPLFGEMIKTLKEAFDFIIIDSPPLLSAIDAAIIASVVDASVLVIGYKSSNRKLARMTVEQLQKTGKPLLGAILNKVESDGRYKYGKYYSKYYGKYYGARNIKSGRGAGND